MFKLLVVEDDRELNKTVCSYLNYSGYEAIGCPGANEAYDALYGGTLFDLIISDIMMPGIDGFEFAKTVRELNQDIPILFMSARDDFAAKQRGFKAGIDDYVVTCCMLLFFRVMQSTGGFVLTEGLIRAAAKLTFGNVLIISLLCTVIDGIRRKFMIERPVRRIVHAADQVMKGDLTVRIPPIHSIDSMNGFDVIADYFNRMTEELSGIETLRTDLIANVSHELKTPLSVIQNYGALLQQKDLPEEKRLEYAKAITGASHSLADLITNILKLNKLENQEIYPNTAEYDLSEQLCECLLMFEEVWEQKGLEIETDIEENLTVNADEELLSLVWNNLFSNAVKFTGPGGKIALSAKSEDDLVVVKVSDTGCGISKETGAHIFEKFYQGDTSHATKGNGLGLALVKRVMDITGGDITVESEVGKGSVFTVKIRSTGSWNDSSIS